MVIINIFYLLILLFYILTVFFIFYHLIKYSINSSLNLLVLPLFVFVAIGLLIFNYLSFSSVDWNNFLKVLN